MFYLFYGTDRQQAREAMQQALAKSKARIVRVTDANTVADLRAALQGGGMFAEKRTVAFENILENAEMKELLLASLSVMKDSEESFFMLEEKPDAATKKQVEKYAEASQKFDAAKKGEAGPSIFALANALRRGDKKTLWIGYQQQLMQGDAPEAIHGVLFWAAKDMFLKSHSATEQARAKKLIALLTVLPHEARRQGEDLEYALERFALSIA